MHSVLAMSLRLGSFYEILFKSVALEESMFPCASLQKKWGIGVGGREQEGPVDGPLTW